MYGNMGPPLLVYLDWRLELQELTDLFSTAAYIHCYQLIYETPILILKMYSFL
jgi:hypothetical protein